MHSKKIQLFLAQFTLDQYNKCINQFLAFCAEVEFSDHSDTDERDAIIAQFLNDIAVKSEKHDAALKTFMGALTHNYKTINAPINSELLTNFCKALTKDEITRPAGRTKIIPIKKFTDMFKAWGNNDNLGLERLRQKSMTLFALSTMCRPSDIAPKVGFYRDQIEFTADGKMKVTYFGIKNDSDMRGQEVKIDPAEIPETDPVETVRLYLAQTKERADTSRGQKRQNPCPSSLTTSDMFARVQQLISVHDNKLRSGTLLAFFGLY